MKFTSAAIALTIAFTAAAQTNLPVATANTSNATNVAVKANQPSAAKPLTIDQRIDALDQSAHRLHAAHREVEAKKVETRANELRAERRASEGYKKNHPIIINFNHPTSTPNRIGNFVGQGSTP